METKKKQLTELESEKRWDKTFSESEDLLSQLADEALEEHRQGKTKILDLDKLWFSYSLKQQI